MKNKTLISDLRKQKGLTQEKLAELTGLNVRTIGSVAKFQYWVQKSHSDTLTMLVYPSKL